MRKFVKSRERIKDLIQTVRVRHQQMLQIDSSSISDDQQDAAHRLLRPRTAGSDSGCPTICWSELRLHDERELIQVLTPIQINQHMLGVLNNHPAGQKLTDALQINLIVLTFLCWDVFIIM